MRDIKVLKNATSEDLSAYEGYAVELGTAGISVCDAITDSAIGIITKGGETESEVCMFGDCIVKLGGTATVGTRMTPHTDGTLLNVAASSTECGIFLESGVAGDWVNAYFVPPMRPQAANT